MKNKRFFWNTLLFLAFSACWIACQKEVAFTGTAAHHPETNPAADRGGDADYCEGSISLEIQTTGLPVPSACYYDVTVESRICPTDPWVFEGFFDETLINWLGTPVAFNVRHDRQYRISVYNLTPPPAPSGYVLYKSVIQSQNTIQTEFFRVPLHNSNSRIYGQGINYVPGRVDCGYGWAYDCNTIGG